MKTPKTKTEKYFQITGNDLKLINFFLEEYLSIKNHDKHNKDIAQMLRNKISVNLSRIRVKIKK